MPQAVDISRVISRTKRMISSSVLTIISLNTDDSHEFVDESIGPGWCGSSHRYPQKIILGFLSSRCIF